MITLHDEIDLIGLDTEHPAVLVVDQDILSRIDLRNTLEKAGFKVSEARSGEEALIRLSGTKPDIVLLSSILPRLSGVEVCARIRRNSGSPGRHLPIIMLGAPNETDELASLEAGADDYLPNLVGPKKLTERLWTKIRRANWDANSIPASPATLSFRDIEVNTLMRSVTRGGTSIDVSPTGYRMLEYLMIDPGRILTRKEAYARFWKTPPTTRLPFSQQILHLRKALGPQDPFKTLYGGGVRLVWPAP